MFLTLQCSSESPEVLIETQVSSIFISNKFPGDTDAAENTVLGGGRSIR